MKYFYSIVIDGYAYSEVTEHRYKNEIDFYFSILGENFAGALESEYTDVWDFLDNEGYYPTGDSYVAKDENNNELPELEDCQVTFENIKKGMEEMMQNLKAWDSVTDTYPGN